MAAHEANASEDRGGVMHSSVRIGQIEHVSAFRNVSTGSDQVHNPVLPPRKLAVPFDAYDLNQP